MSTNIMNTNVFSLVDQLSDHQLVAQVKLLAQDERDATASLIAHLAVLDERGLYRAEGYSSAFTYCLQVLHLSEHAAYGRIEAARAARKYPIILELLANGSVNLTTVTLLAPHLTPENHVTLLELSPAVEAAVPARRPVIAPLAPQQYKVQFTANAETHAKLLRAQELLRSQIPDGGVGEIIDRALTALLNEPRSRTARHRAST